MIVLVVIADDDTQGAGTRHDQARQSWLRVAAWGVLLVTELAVVATVFALIGSGLPWRFLFTSYPVTNAWLAGTFAPFGALVALRRPRLLIGWFICGFALCYGLSAAGIAFSLWQATAGGPNHWTSVVGWIGISVWTPAIAVFFPLIVLLFPDGRLASRSIRRLATIAAIDGVVWCVLSALDASSPGTVPFIKYAPIHLPSSLAHFVHTVGRFDNSVPNWTAVACLAVLFWRWHRSSGDSRAQLSWLLVGAALAVALFAPTGAGVDTLWSTSLILGVLVFPISASIAVLRHQLLGIDIVINRTLMYAALTGILLGCFLAVVELAGLVAGRNPGLVGSLPAAAVVAIAFAPARQFLQRRMDTMLFGFRRDPAQALRRVASQLTSNADDELGASLRAVSESLRLPDLLLVSDGRRIGSPTFRTDGATQIPLKFGAHPVGELWVRPRRGQSELDSSDIAALELIAVPIAAAVHAIRLSEQLQQSRRQLIDAQAEERRRLHRDLHDGLGPALTAIALRADAAGNVSLTDPTKSKSLITELADQTRQAISEVRRIAHDLGPQSLESLNLLEALNRQAASFASRLGGGTLIVTTNLPDVLPAMPVNMRNAAFRIVTEALNNIARHSNATAAVIRIQCGPSLVLEVCDNGTSLSGSWDQGFGLTSMRERAISIGATFCAGPTPSGGRIHVEFPLPIPARMGRS